MAVLYLPTDESGFFMRRYFFNQQVECSIISRSAKTVSGICFFLLLFTGLLPNTVFAGDKQPAGIFCDICGQQISGRYIQTSDGHTYHQTCYDKAEKCPICLMPIISGQKTATLSDGRVCHLSCLDNADFCSLCGEPICRGQVYLKSEKYGETWHESCFNAAPKCGITGRPIAPGVATVKIGKEIFIKAAYDKSRKCLVSGLPVVNHGRYIVNARTGTFVLEKFKDKVHKCYSCGDSLPDGYDVGHGLFLCRYCYENGIKDSLAAQPYLNVIKTFFKEQGVTFPENVKIVILPPGQLIDDNLPALKGHCRNLLRTNTITGGGTLTHTIELLWGLNPDVFLRVATHEFSHAVIAEARFAASGKIYDVPYEEGRCEYTAYTFARSRGLPAYIIDGFSKNQVENYRKEFLHVLAHPPENIKTLLTAIDF
ncbi:MAG: hypothetical protein B5M56_10625 [Desulfococcus sp. 4484_241]|nr:MAG: hypothetical protein B5M56_10625 [Desulfococcus sp. 4484_241]